MVLTYARFTKYKNIFHKKVTESPATATIIITTATQDPGSFDAFVGNSPRTEVSKTLTTLHTNTPLEFELTTAGIAYQYDAIAYFSPQQLIEAFGTFRLDPTKTKVTIQGKTFIVSSVQYMNEVFPNECVAVELKLKDSLRG